MASRYKLIHAIGHTFEHTQVLIDLDGVLTWQLIRMEYCSDCEQCLRSQQHPLPQVHAAAAELQRPVPL